MDQFLYPIYQNIHKKNEEANKDKQMAVLSSCTIDPTEFHLTSMTLISSSSSSKPLESKALKSRDFLNAFELWSDGNISGKNQDCAEILFHALGDTYQQHHKQKW